MLARTHGHNRGTGQVRNRYGTGRDRYWTGTGQVRERYGTSTGQVRDRYGTGTGQVRDRYGTGTGQVRNRYGTGTEQVYGYLSRRCTRSPVHLRKQLKDTCRYLFRTSSVPDPYNTEQPKQSHIESKSRQKRPEKRGMNGYQVITSKQSLCFDTAFHPIKATPKHKLQESILVTVSATCFCHSSCQGSIPVLTSRF